jgi:light-regulated signal transduction histidine kinase (bacteriophytochrome)
MSALVRYLLAYTRISKLEPESTLTNADAALDAALKALSDSIASSSAVITRSALPKVPMHTTHLQQVFQNLIGNAIKYRHEGKTPTVHISATQAFGRYTFSVRDNGMGIADDYKEAIFGLFKRLHTSEEYSGTGLGLAICQRIIERYNGRLWVESALGEGSTFFFTI